VWPLDHRSGSDARHRRVALQPVRNVSRKRRRKILVPELFALRRHYGFEEWPAGSCAHRDQVDGLQADPGFSATCSSGHTFSPSKPIIHCSASTSRRSVAQTLQKARQFFQRVDEKLRPRCSQAFFCRERTEYADGHHTGALRHFNILRSVSDIHTTSRFELQLLESQPKLFGMRFFSQRIPAANARRKQARQTKLAQLVDYAISIATGDQTNAVLLADCLQNASHARDQFGPVLRILLAPRPVRLVPKF